MSAIDAVVVTGGRDYDNYTRLELFIALSMLKHNGGGTPEYILHGAAPGADALASHYAYEHDCDVRAYGAEWLTHGKAAGPKRNIHMLSEAERLFGAHRVIVCAFPTKNSRGTWDCVRKASERGFIVEVDRTETTVVRSMRK